jgi:hypothetical protein
MKRLVKVCLYILVFAAFILPPLYPTQAAGTTNWTEDFAEGYKKSTTENSIGSEGYTYSIGYNNIATSLVFQGAVVEGITVPVGTLNVNSPNYDPKYAEYIYSHGAISKVNNTIVAIYSNPPASTSIAIRDMGESLGILPKSVYAQGVGFAGLSPILPIWKAFRNIAYLLLAVVMVVIGFMVMLRKKIDPKTVVTVQNALPRIVVSLILITFSYAIVGILIDVMYLLIYLALGIFQSTNMLDVSSRLAGHQNAAYLYANGNLMEVSGAAFPSQWGLFDVANALLGTSTTNTAISTGVAGVIGTLIGGPGMGLIAAGIASGPSILVTLLLSLAILFTIIRLAIMFLNAYVQIVLSLIISPLQLLLEAVPGANGFSGWIKNLIANLSVFPISAIMFMLASVFSKAATSPSVNMWAPPYLITGTTGNSSTISALFAIGIMMAIPNICGSIKEALKAKSSAPGIGIGGLFAPVTGTVTSGLGIAQQFYYGQTALHGISGLFNKKH